MHNNPTPADRRLAVACMRHLLTEMAAKMPSGKQLSAERQGTADHAGASLKLLQACEVCTAAHSVLQMMA